MNNKMRFCAGALLYGMISVFTSLQAHTITIHNRLPENVIVKFDHVALADSHKMVPTNSTLELDVGIKCTRGIEIESGSYAGAKADNLEGSCSSATFWLTRNKDKTKIIETRGNDPDVK